MKEVLGRSGSSPSEGNRAIANRNTRLSPKHSAIAIVAIVAGATASCGSDQGPPPVERTARTSAAVNTAPKIGDFVIYAERSVTLGVSDQVNAGDVGVHSVAPASFGTQLKVGNLSSVQPTHNLLSPSVSLGTLSVVGDVQTNSLQNNGALLGTQSSFPSSAMPVVPLATPPAAGGANVTVPAFTITNLAPGSYGALSVTGTLLLNPGTYSFSSVVIAGSAHVAANAGGVTVFVGGGLVAGASATILAGIGFAAGQLAIFAAGADGSASSPAVSIGAHSQIGALIAAPHGTIALASDVTATGALVAEDVTVGDRVTLNYQSGFGGGRGAIASKERRP